MRTLAVVLCLAAAASAAPTPAAAEGKGGGGDWRTHCGDDVDRLCPKTRDPGACIHAHWDDLSEGCRSFKEGMKKQWAGKGGENKGGWEGKQGGGGGDWKASCGADVERFCAGSPKPGMCLHEHWDELSPECRAFKEGMKRQWEKKRPDPMKEACGGDLERLCPDAPNPGACLHEHWDELSRGCRDLKESTKRQGEGKKGKMKFEWSEKKKEEGSSE